MSIQQQKFKEIADKIRERLGTTDAIKPSDFASKIEDVYKAGQNAGGGGSYEQGVTDGRAEMLDAMWDDFQVKGTRVDYRFAFAYMNGNNFYPKYDISPTNQTNNAFYKFNGSGSSYVNLYDRLDARGITLDLSAVTNTQLMFGYAKISRIGTLDISNVTNLDRCFYNIFGLTKIDKLIVSEINQFVNNYGSVFYKLNDLTDIEFEGVIADNIDIQHSPLSKSSIENVVSVLSDSTTDKTVTFNETAVNNAFTADEWNALMNSKQNWSFAFGQEG